MRFWLSTVGILLSLLVPRLALAQVVTLQQTGISRVNSDGSTVTTKSTTNMNVFQRVNGADCYGTDDKGIEYVFPITVAMETAPTQHHIEVWAGGSDCSPLASRQQATAVCWPVSATASFPPNATVQYIRIRAQDIVSQISSTSHTLTYSAADKTACTSTTTTATVTVYFLLLDGSANPVGTPAPWAMKVKLIGPVAPDPISADGLDNAAHVGWTAVTDPDEVGYRVFVDQGTGGTSMADAQGTPVTTCADGGVDDSGDAADGGCTTTIVYDGGGSTPSTCGTGLLVGGGRADQLTAAAQAGKVDTSATVSKLSNGGSYAVAVATVDSYDNVGPLSNPVCVTPQPVLDFWKRYESSGGTAGGFCALEAPGGPTGSMMGLGLAFAAIAFARRRKR